MRGLLILGVFFLMFTFAYLIIPYPMFPGSMLTQMGFLLSGYEFLLSGIINGIFYASILWVIFLGLSGRLGEEK